MTNILHNLLRVNSFVSFIIKDPNADYFLKVPFSLDGKSESGKCFRTFVTGQDPCVSWLIFVHYQESSM